MELQLGQGRDQVPEGALALCAGVLAACEINVIYSYSMISTYIVLSTPDIEHAERLLKNEPVELVDQEAITRLGAENMIEGERK